MKKVFWLLGVIFTFGISLLVSKKERVFFKNLCKKEEKLAKNAIHKLENTSEELAKNSHKNINNLKKEISKIAQNIEQKSKRIEQELTENSRDLANKIKKHNFKTVTIRTYADKRSGYWKIFFIEKKNLSYGLLGLAAFSFLASDLLEPYSYLFKASLINLPKTEFTGTVTPVEKVPNWSILSSAEYKAVYSKIPKNKFINLPKYDVFAMRAGKTWASATTQERNTYITYPVPNLGNYKLDGTENTGSHPGVDIKIPIGTPIRSIANGVVYKVQNKTTGYGKAVSIAHVGVPDPQNPSKKVTLVSTYAHLSSFSVREGQIIKKGQIIAKSGSSGMSTAPHLHFQIDRGNAPFIPYWPFTYNDVKKAGFNSFFDAVRNGLGQQKAKQYTVHPINFVAKFNDFTGGNLVASTDNNIVKYSAPKQAIKTTRTKKTYTNRTHKTHRTHPTRNSRRNNLRKNTAPMPVDPSKIELVKPENVINKKNQVEEIATNTATNKTEQIIETEISRDFAENPQTIVKKDFEIKQKIKSKNPSTEADNRYARHIAKTGKLKVEFTTDSQNFVPGREKLIKVKINEATLIASDGILLSSTINDRAEIFPTRLKAQDFQDGIATVRVKTEAPYRFKMIATGDFGETKSNTLRPTIFTDVDERHPYADAISYLKDMKIINGYHDGSFKPKNSLNRAEAIKIILVANNIIIEDANVDLQDVAKDAWYRKYIGTAISRGIVNGYPDQTFKPANTISRAEFLKIAILTAGFKPQNIAENPYKDIDFNAWYAPYFEFAKQKHLLEVSNNQAIPAQVITREEAADVIYKLSRLRK
jgi:murein DD-endopeptidase MepM/ murein hydrolase activator NlpD/F0F1-type ATP synthase membrane subunit b/b'